MVILKSQVQVDGTSQADYFKAGQQWPFPKQTILDWPAMTTPVADYPKSNQ